MPLTCTGSKSGMVRELRRRWPRLFGRRRAARGERDGDGLLAQVDDGCRFGEFGFDGLDVDRFLDERKNE